MDPVMPSPDAAGSRRRQWKGQGVNLALLTLVWVLLVGEVSLLSLGGGLVLAWLVSRVFPLPLITWSGRLHPWGLVMLVVRLLADLATASVQLALFAFNPSAQPRSGVVAVELSSDGDLYQVGTGTLLSIVPGSVVVDARRRTRTLYLHIFDMAPERLTDLRRHALEAERRVLEAFGSAAEIVASRANLASGEPKW